MGNILLAPVKYSIFNLLYQNTVKKVFANLATLSLDLATFQTPLATFFLQKAPSNKSSDFWTNLSIFPNVASTVL